jgi:cyclopropane fatty-acyl-phospholipid synthase-like methyltransferase
VSEEFPCVLSIQLSNVGNANPWVAKYIFPGGYMPALSEIMPAIERSGLFVTDVEILRLARCADAQGLARTLRRATRRG